MDENKKLFREKSLERISSPEQLNDYIKVANPSVWMILAAVIVLLAGFIFWGCTAKLQTTIPCVVDCEENVVTGYVSEQKIAQGKVTMDNKVVSNGYTYAITAIDGQALNADEVLSDYEKHLCNFSDGEWIHALDLKCISYEGTESSDTGAHAGTIVIESISPISFVLSKNGEE